MSLASLPLIPTASIGSMPKPAWLTDKWYSVQERWMLEGEALAQALDDATRLAVGEQEAAGIDIVCDGEQRRPTHYSYFLRQLSGIDEVNLTPKSMRGGKVTQSVPRVVGDVKLVNHVAVDDYRAARQLTNRALKMTLPGPTTLVDGTFDAHYGDEKALAFAFADALNAEIRALEAAGCTIVQLDEPAFTRLPGKTVAYGAAALDRAFAGTGVTSCVHICYGYRSWSAAAGGKEWRHGYHEIFPALAASGVQHFSLEFAEPGLPASILSELPCKTIELGVVSCGDNQVETPELVAARLRDALEFVPAQRLIAAPDCGCVALTRAAARGKLRALALGAQIARFSCASA
jgi:5-methyltetrahydropteroyltriglutamate--homocysteine methyltransferase